MESAIKVVRSVAASLASRRYWTVGKCVSVAHNLRFWKQQVSLRVLIPIGIQLGRGRSYHTFIATCGVCPSSPR